jgi:NDP-sugar pyrophosphorylase family protein
VITTAVILAAGRGTRLGEVTRTRSKAMVPVCGEPMVARVMHEFSRAGIRRFVVVAAPTDSELRRYFAGREGITVLEQSEPRGSGDALRVCEGQVADSFLVAACDSLVSSREIRQLCELHERELPQATIGVLSVTPDTPLGARSVVHVDAGRIVQFIEKPGLHERISNITALPLYACREKIFIELRSLSPSERGEYELTAIFSKLAQSGGNVLASEVSQRHDLTNARDLLDLNRVFLERLNPTVQIDSSSVIAPGVKIIAPVLIGPGCVVHEGATLGDCVYLEEGVTVAAGSSVKRAVALKDASLTGQVEGVVVSTLQ